MYRLTATYEIDLGRWIRVTRAEDDALRYAVTIDGFDVEILLIPNGGARGRHAGDKFDTRAIARLKASVSRNEESPPPTIATNKHGNQDITERSSWFAVRAEEYRTVAVKAVNRLLRFCKYKLQIPNVRELSAHDTRFENPKWIGPDHSELSSGIIEMSATILSPRGPGLLGEKDFTEDDDASLQNALQNDLAAETYQEFLSDAQSSIVNGNVRRAILEMAIACEIAVKQAFFREATTAGAAYEYLEHKGLVNVRVIDLIHNVAKEVFGESFKDIEKDGYQHIDLLFQSRNKVAHRGKAIYRDAAGEHPVAQAILEEWWLSVDLLMTWIAKHRG